MAGCRQKTEVEQELKIKVSAEDLEAVFNALADQAVGGKVAHKYLPRYYYDTVNMDFYHNGISVRVQYKPGKDGKLGGYEQTVKFELPHGTAVAQGALFRKECKDIIASRKPDLAAVSDPEAGKIVQSFKAKRLKHIFTAAIERRSFDVQIGRGKNRGKVEVAFDVGEIIIPGKGGHYPFSEIEIEIKEGAPAAIERIHSKIKKIAPLAKVQPLSKADQGSRIYLRNYPQAGK